VGGYAVDPVELQRCDVSIAATTAASRAALADLRESVAHSLGGRWQGSAARAFAVGWQHWLDGVTAMLDALDEMALALGDSGAGYTAADDAVRTSLAGVAR
jgi:WXG100 family type VII secretion target